MCLVKCRLSVVNFVEHVTYMVVDVDCVCCVLVAVWCCVVSCPAPR